MTDRSGVLGVLERAAKGFCEPIPMQQAYLRIAELIAAGNRVTAAFRAHGVASGVVDTAKTRNECEAAMLALDTALKACRGDV